jgi:trans-2,3-dihydro-3-hydroxyanthranilate isomerase
MRYRYAMLDVFTETPLAGNPLAVVFDADGMTPERMQAVAREFNLSETVFVLKPEAEIHRARLRIFTPGRELPFAGHPTVGSAVILGLKAESRLDAQAFGLEEKVGIVPCVVETRGERAGYARFRLPRLPEFLEGAPDPMEAAWALGLDPSEIGFDRHMPSRHSAGNPFDFVPVNSLDAVARGRPRADAFDKVFGSDHPGIYVYARQNAAPGRHFRGRMFGAPGAGFSEDPATGSAAAAFAGVLMQCEPLGEGEHSLVIEQGYEMGRPSEIELQVVIAEGALRSAEIGGHAVLVAEGEIEA